MKYLIYFGKLKYETTNSNFIHDYLTEDWHKLFKQWSQENGFEVQSITLFSMEIQKVGQPELVLTII